MEIQGDESMSNLQTEQLEAVEPETAKKDKENSLIAINKETLALSPTDHVQLVRFVDQMIKAKAFPKHLETREQIIVAWNFAAQLKLPPQPSLRNIAVIEGTPSLFGDLPLALVQKHEDFVFIREYCIDKDYKMISVKNQNLTADPWGGVCELQRKGMEHPQEFAFTKADAERAGLLRRAKDGMPWKSYPQVMLVRRARSLAIKTLFADAITGAAIAEDQFNWAPDVGTRDVTPTVIDKGALLNEKFKRPLQAVAPEVAGEKL